MKEIKMIELFAGIGAPAKALTNLGIPFKSKAIEIDKHAVKSYNAIHGKNISPSSVTDFEAHRYMNKVDLLFHGSPCQDFSIAGKGLGGGDR